MSYATIVAVVIQGDELSLVEIAVYCTAIIINNEPFKKIARLALATIRNLIILWALHR